MLIVRRGVGISFFIASLKKSFYKNLRKCLYNVYLVKHRVH